MQLRDSEERYRTVFQTCPDAVMISRLSDGVILDANQTLLDMAGYERNKFVGHTTTELGIWVNDGDRQKLVDELLRNTEFRDFEVPFRRKNGETFWVRLDASLIEIGGIRCLLAFAQDISAAKEAKDLADVYNIRGLLEAEATRLACRFGGGEVVGTVAASPQAALAMLGRLLTWTQDGAPFVPPEMLTQEDLIRYLRLDVDNRDPVERVRNLIRYQGLPVTRRGRLLLFRKVAVDQWLDVPPQRSYARRRLGRGAPANLNRKETA